jgi:hypothetical protein
VRYFFEHYLSIVLFFRSTKKIVPQRYIFLRIYFKETIFCFVAKSLNTNIIKKFHIKISYFLLPPKATEYGHCDFVFCYFNELVCVLCAKKLYKLFSTERNIQIFLIFASIIFFACKRQKSCFKTCIFFANYHQRPFLFFVRGIKLKLYHLLLEINILKEIETAKLFFYTTKPHKTQGVSFCFYCELCKIIFT